MPITDRLTIGTVAPQSGGLVSAIHAPVLVGFQAYLDMANAQNLVDDVQLDLVVADDEGKPELSPVAVAGILEADAQVVSAVPGATSNLAIRNLLNVNCVPQLMALTSTPRLADVTNFPWSMSGDVADDVETAVYANAIRRSLGGGTSIAILAVNDEGGASYADAFVAAALENNLEVVTRQTVEPGVIDPPVAQMLTIASHRPDVLVVSLSGPACATFLTELDRDRQALPGWEPQVYVSEECGDSSLLGLAGGAADGVMTATHLRDDDPDFIAEMQAAGVTTGFSRAARGWTAAEVTVEILAQAQQSAAGLTRATIIEAARNLSYVPSLARPGVACITNGVEDGAAFESLQVIRYESATQTFSDVGPLVAQFES